MEKRIYPTPIESIASPEPFARQSFDDALEAVADLGMLVPALRVESYHDALIDSMSLTRRASTTGRMLERLRNAIDAELTSIESTEARADDARRNEINVAAPIVSQGARERRGDHHQQ